MKHRCHLFLIQLVIVVCFDNLHNAAALHGQQVQPVEATDKLSFVASLSYDDSENHVESGHFCTGIYIYNQFVLTARHCVENMANRKSVIYLGCPSLESCKKYHWESWTSYGTWATINKLRTDAVNDDIAVVKLKEKVENIQPAILHSNPLASNPGEKFYVAGWGHLENGIKPDYMQKASVNVLSIEECKTRTQDSVTPGYFDWERKICTKSETNYAVLSRGDSGGPLYDEQYRVVGINLGVCPFTGKPPQERVNIHGTVLFYRDFFSSIYRA